MPEPRKIGPRKPKRGRLKVISPPSINPEVNATLGGEGRKRRRAEALAKLKASDMTELDVLRYRLSQYDPDLPEVFERCIEGYIKAISGGDLSALDEERAAAFATKALIRKKAAEGILEKGAMIEEEQFDKDGDFVGLRVKAHPLLEPLSKLDEQLGYTAEQERLTKRSQGQGARDDALAARLRRDVQLRAANKLGLPAPDPEILRDSEVIDTEVVAE